MEQLVKNTRKLKVVKNTVSVSSRDPSGFLNPFEERSYRHSGRVVNPSDTPPNSRELLRNDCSCTIVKIRNVLPTLISMVTPIQIVGLFSTSENCCSVDFRAFSVFAKIKMVTCLRNRFFKISHVS